MQVKSILWPIKMRYELKVQRTMQEIKDMQENLSWTNLRMECGYKVSTLIE